MKILQPKRSGLRFAVSSVVAAGTLGWCGCGGDPKAITSQTSKYEVADDNPSNEPPANDPGSVTPSAIDSSATANRTRPSTDTSGSASPVRAPDNSGPTSDPAVARVAPVRPTSQPPSEPETAPADGPSRLLAHIEKLQNQDPRAATREESLGNLVKIQREIIETADLVVASNADETSVLRAAEAKIQALTFLAQIQREAQGEIKLFVSQLKKNPHPRLIRLANRMELAQLMDSFANGETTDAAKVVAEFKQLFEKEEKEAALFSLSQQVSEVFLGTGHFQEAAEIMRLLADTFDSHSNAELAKASKMIREQVPMLELDLNGKFNAVREGKPKADEEFLATLDKLCTDRELGATTLQILAQMVQIIETKDLELAGKTLTKMTAAFAKQSTPEVAQAVEGMATNFGKRKAIVGQPFTIEGVTLDGQPFDWGKYQGKVVLVDFWATWCQPCLEEVPNIKQNYDQYHEQGFEVVGINLDEKPEDVQRFFSFQRLPWPTVLGPNPQAIGFNHPVAVKYGVDSPFVVLVGRDGKALALNLRGEELGKKLATMFTGSGESQSNPLRSNPPKKADSKGGAD